MSKFLIFSFIVGLVVLSAYAESQYIMIHGTFPVVFASLSTAAVILWRSSEKDGTRTQKRSYNYDT